MKVKFKSTFAGVVDVYQSGQIYDVEKDFAERLIASGEAELVVGEKEKTNTANKKV